MNERVNELGVKLKIPRHHFQYLAEHGTLEEFVKAKYVEDNDAAREALDRAMENDKQKRKLMSVDNLPRSQAMTVQS